MAARDKKSRRPPASRSDAKVPGGGLLILGGTLIAAAAGAAWAAHRARVTTRLRRDRGDESSRGNKESSCMKGLKEIQDIIASDHDANEELCMKSLMEKVDIQKNGFNQGNRVKSEVSVATVEINDHLETSVNKDVAEDSSLNIGDSSKVIAEESMTTNFKEVKEEIVLSEVIEEQGPSIASEGEDSESSLDEENNIREMGLDESGASFVESMTEIVGQGGMVEREKFPPLENIEMKNNSAINECDNDAVNVAQVEEEEEEETIEEYEHKGAGQEKVGDTAADESMNTTTAWMETGTDITSINQSKSNLLVLESGNKENSEISMAKKEEHLEANTKNDDGINNISLPSDEYNMPGYPNKSIEEDLGITISKEVDEERKEGKQIEEAFSIQSETEEADFTVDEVAEKGEVGSDDTEASSVVSNAETIWPSKITEKDESLVSLEPTATKNNLVIQEGSEEVVHAEHGENEIVEDNEHKDARQEKEAAAAINMSSIGEATTMMEEKENGLTYMNREKSKIDTQEEESHLKADIKIDDVQNLSSNIDESSIPDYPNKEMAKGLRSTSFKEVGEERKQAADIEEEAPLIESKGEEAESSAEQERLKEGLISLEPIEEKIDLPAQERINDVFDAAHNEEEVDKEYEHKDTGVKEAEKANESKNTFRPTTTTMMEKQTNFASMNKSKSFVLLLVLALAIGLVSFAHHSQVIKLYHQLSQIFLTSE